MPHVTCPECDYLVGLGVASDIGRCPSCDVPLMLTCEMRALSPEQVAREMERQARLREERAALPLNL